jgi:hypothetical protein
MRNPILLLGCLVIVSGCDSAVAPVSVIAATELETSVRVSAREISRANPPDSLFIRIRVEQLPGHPHVSRTQANVTLVRLGR